MMAKLKNILIFTAIAGIFILIFIFFVKKSPEDGSTLVSSSPNGVSSTTSPVAPTDPAITQDFLTLLLSVKSIKLDSKIFADPAFISLRDSSIILEPDGNEGRPNPFAPIGSDATQPLSVSTTAPKTGTTPTN